MSDYKDLEDPDRFILDIIERILEMLREFQDTRSELHRLGKIEIALDETLKYLGRKFSESGRKKHIILDAIIMLEDIKSGINPSICQHEGCEKEVAVVISLIDGRMIMRYCPEHMAQNT